jgi:hypothetical protein
MTDRFFPPIKILHPQPLQVAPLAPQHDRKSLIMKENQKVSIEPTRLREV